MTTTIPVLKKLNTRLPWTDRLWKQLNQSDKTINSALFFGKPGLGKSQLTLNYARQILKNDDVFLGGNHPDLHVLIPEDEAASIAEKAKENSVSENTILTPEDLLATYGLRYLEKNSGKPKKVISVQQIRSLIQQIMQHSHLAEHKVVIIQSADKMNINASNALLKTLEEPPSNTSFILIANQIERLPVTIRSRCTEFHFRSPNVETGLQWLEEHGLKQHMESYLMMASRAPLAALELSEQNEIEKLRNLFSSINQLWGKKISAIALANEWKKYDFNNIFNHLCRLLSDLIKLKLIKDSPKQYSEITELFYPVQQEWSEKISTSVNLPGLFKTIDEIQSIKRLGSGPSDKQLLLENAAIQLEKLALNQA